MNKFIKYIWSRLRKKPVDLRTIGPGLAEILINTSSWSRDSQFEELREQARKNIDNAKGGALFGSKEYCFKRLRSHEEEYRDRKLMVEAKLVAALSNKKSRIDGLKIKRSDRGKR